MNFPIDFFLQSMVGLNKIWFHSMQNHVENMVEWFSAENFQPEAQNFE